MKSKLCPLLVTLAHANPMELNQETTCAQSFKNSISWLYPADDPSAAVLDLAYKTCYDNANSVPSKSFAITNMLSGLQS